MEQARQELRRSERATRFVRFAGWCILYGYHEVIVEGEENLPKQGTALLLPKHWSYRDIVMLGVALYGACGRFASYVAKFGSKANPFGVLEKVGVAVIVRPKDALVWRRKKKISRKAITRWARLTNNKTFQYLSFLYQSGELVISYPEGTRCPGFMGPLKRGVLDHALGVQQDLGIAIPLIPIGVAFENINQPRSRVWIRVGEPVFSKDFESKDELIEHLKNQIARLSGLEQGL